MKITLKRMSSCNSERMRNSESLEFPMKSEIEDSFPLSAVKLENNDVAGRVALFNEGSLFMDPDMEFKAEPEVFESSEGDMKYSYNSDTLASDDDLQSCKTKANKEDESVKTYLMIDVKEQCSNGEVNKEVNEIKEKIEDSGCEKPLCQESDPKTHTDVGTREKSFVCECYGKQSSGIVDFDTSMLMHAGGWFKCRECGKKFSKEVDLKAHYETHTKRSFKCSDCGKAFFQRHVLTAHYRIHTGEKPFKCDVCGKAFTKKSHLTAHCRTHTGEKPFKCNICDKAFTQKSNLTTHLITHTVERPFKCNACDKAFFYKSTFSVHMRIHTGNLFRCPECGKEFTLKYDLTKHYRIHTGEKPFKCCDCEMAFTWKSGLSKHKKICARENL